LEAMDRSRSILPNGQDKPPRNTLWFYRQSQLHNKQANAY
jgi:hypothetical protein